MKLDYLVLSDIHLGHRKTRTKHTVQGLDELFDNYSAKSPFTAVDMIFIAGDLFDSLLDFSDDDIHEASLWLGRLMTFCAVYNIKLRVLRGTPSHDWNQPKISETVYKLAMAQSLKTLDFRYIDTLYIEDLKELQLHILYVPDEWTASTDLTFSQVQELLAKAGIEQVDIAIMHGMFSYQTGNIPGIHGAHSEANYLPIVRHFINIGHHHTFSFNDKIVAQGSVDRLAHGQEEAKGMTLMHIDTEQGNRFEFIENKQAKAYVTVELKGKDLDRGIAKLDKVIDKLPKDSYIRVRAHRDHPVMQGFEEVRLRYPLMHLDKQVEKDEEELKKAKTIESIDYVPISITPDNVVELLIEEIKAKALLSPDRQDKLQNLLKEIRDF